MTLEVLNGGAPAVPSESATPGSAQENAATTDALSGGADGGNEGQVTPKTYSEEELRDRIERATAKAAAKAERRAFREAAERLATQRIPQTQQVTQQSDGRPSRAQYQSEDAYLDALTDWKLDQREARAQAERQQEQQQTLARKTEDIYAKAEKIPGFDRDAFDELPLTKPIVEALVDSDAPDKLMHYMAANPAEVERIAKLSPARQAAELGKLEDKALAAKPPARSNAPQALAPAKGKGVAGDMPDPSDTKAYVRWANAQERGR